MNAKELNSLCTGKRTDYLNKLYSSNHNYTYAKFAEVGLFKYAENSLALATLNGSLRSAFIDVNGNLSLMWITVNEVYNFDVDERTAYLNQMYDSKLDRFHFLYVGSFKDYMHKFNLEYFARAQTENDEIAFVNIYGVEKPLRELNILNQRVRAKNELDSFIFELEHMEKIAEYPFGIYVRADKLHEIINKYKK